MTLPVPVDGLALRRDGPLVDRFGRAHTYLRVSVTDRCNYRCVYCMPAEGLDWIPHGDVLTYEEIARIVRVMAGMGVERVRITGGEPTVRRDLDALVEQLGAVPGLHDLSMTTNGHLLAPRVTRLAAAGLRRVNISLDTLDPERFKAITRGGDLFRVLHAIQAARDAGLAPVKINAVIVRGENDHEILPLIEYFAPHAADTSVRFIEYMPFRDAPRRHVSSAEIRERVASRYRLEPCTPDAGGGPATTWHVADTGLVVGFISPITEHFCQSCNRLRLMTDGHLRTCLSRDDTPSLRDLLRAGIGDDELAWEIRKMVWGKVAGHEAHLGDGEGFRAFEGVMTRIGG